jgi:hypothetical protein
MNKQVNNRHKKLNQIFTKSLELWEDHRPYSPKKYTLGFVNYFL